MTWVDWCATRFCLLLEKRKPLVSESKAEFQKQDDNVKASVPNGDGARKPVVDPSVTQSSVTQAMETVSDLTGQKLGDFQLLKQLGTGGMAVVYLAEQLSLKRHVAVKVLREEMLSDEVHLQRFEQEAFAAGGLNHPNIVQVFMIGEQDGVHYIAQEYVAGCNLREHLLREGIPELPEALRLIEQIAAALEVASDAGIVHRDVKPENILMTEKGDVKVADFGLAQLSLSEERAQLTQVGMTMGTPLYMSPEQVSGQPLDHRSDLYSLGITSYHLLTGRPPFHGETALSIAVQHVNNESLPLQELRNDLPDVVCRMVHKMMEKRPDDRYQTAEALIADCRKISQLLSDDPTALSRMRLADSDHIPEGWNWFDRVAHWSWKRQLLTFFGLLFLVGGLSAGVGHWVRPTGPFETEPVQKNKPIPKKETAFAQCLYASAKKDESAWKAVSLYFPEEKDRIWRQNAQTRLAILYVRTKQFEKAEEIFTGFTIADDKNEPLKAAGYAGLALVAFHRDNGGYPKAYDVIISDLEPYRDRDRLKDEELKSFVDDVRKHYLNRPDDMR